MKPATSAPWRKTIRQEARGVDTGRRASHVVKTQKPKRGSTNARRHPVAVLEGAQS